MKPILILQQLLQLNTNHTSMNIERRLTVFCAMIAACHAAVGDQWKASVAENVDALGNCSLEITQVKDYDNGPFCFRVELARTEDDASTPDKFSFAEDCVALTMLPVPLKPVLGPAKMAHEGRPYTAICRVTHTCPTHAPELTWSKGNRDDVTILNREIQAGLWEFQSVLTFVPQATDDHLDITCTATFYGNNLSSSSKFTLVVKRSEKYHHIIIPTVVGVGIAALFGGLSIVIVKRYKSRIAELQSRSR
ncbi:uncharacterized protein LOC133501473 [Syngnathoides biaculeatus]|uniref:uncharacterized protein LOC133501473 n=1 Tax=Syngnathoides biaculeatus TaxID=300417 RepID=UPI002ADDF7F2|nr:uncharacterized protein LOC133501473 [Syngnathoides biaculeatus]